MTTSTLIAGVKEEQQERIAARLVESDAAAINNSSDCDDCYSNDAASDYSTTDGKDRDIKPSHSYIGLIAMAILSSPDNKMVLGDIYTYISERHPFYKSHDKSWRNSIRHNLSLNECFVKAGRSEKGKGNYWSIHPANIDDFAKGDYRRRRSRKKVRRGYAEYSYSFFSGSARPIPYPLPGINGGFPGFPYGLQTVTNDRNLPKREKWKSFDIESILRKDDSPIGKQRTLIKGWQHHPVSISKISSQDLTAVRPFYCLPSAMSCGTPVCSSSCRPASHLETWMHSKKATPSASFMPPYAKF